MRTATYIFIAILLVSASSAHAQLSSSNYQIDNYSVGTTDTDSATSTNYEVGYANDATLEYDAPSSGGSNGGGGGGGQSISMTETNDADEGDDDSAAPEPDSVDESGADESTDSPQSATTAPPPPSTPDPDATNTDTGAELEATDTVMLTYDPGETATRTLRGVFSDGGVVTATIQPGTFATDAGEITIMIERVPYYTRYRPHDAGSTMFGDSLYRVSATAADGTTIETFAPSVKFSLLFPDRPVPQGSGAYRYEAARDAWQRANDTKMGSNVVSFSTSVTGLFGVFRSTEETLALTPPETPPAESAPEATSSAPQESRSIEIEPLYVFAGLGALALIVVGFIAYRLFIRRDRARGEM